MTPPNRDAVRIDALTGTPVIVSAHRQARPERLPAADAAGEPGCPFCPGGLEAPEPYVVRWFVNRWPALPDGRSQVLLYSPDHDASLWSLGVDGARRVVDLWTERTAALGERPDVAYVLLFENRGAEVGATISHPHGQVYAFAEVPPVPARELAASECALCAEEPGPRVVTSAGAWQAWVPAASGWPFGMVLAPRAHRPDLPTLADDERHDLARLLVDVLARLDRLFGAPMPYLLWVHQRPTDGDAWPQAHVHIEISPQWRARGTPRYVASGELGSGVLFNPVPPEDAARRLREA
ncbi:MAG: galactose-1-phosphate uridylyltransferase [Actinomycetota bacterium]|nr:galactose-1-phosphate uridylyltransferase [Actinomycetota bacterium]